MINHSNIAGRPSNEQLAEFVVNPESGVSPLESITYDELPDGWNVVEHPMSKNDIFDSYRGSTPAERFDAQYGVNNWGVMNRDELSVDIIAGPESLHDGELQNELGQVAVNSVADTTEAKG